MCFDFFSQSFVSGEKCVPEFSEIPPKMKFLAQKNPSTNKISATKRIAGLAIGINSEVREYSRRYYSDRIIASINQYC